MAKLSIAAVGLRDVLVRNEDHISLLACVAGFALDLTALPGIDHPFTQFVCIVYFSVAAFTILLFQTIAAERTRIRFMLTLALQFVLGGLLSVVFVYYFRSSSLIVSWPLVLLLGLLLAGNEIWKKRFAQLDFRVTVLFLLFLFYSIFTVPLLFGEIGTKMFLLSVAFAVSALGIYILVLTSVAMSALKANGIRLFMALSFSSLIVVVFYFVNIIPPIPLVTRTDGVYHSLIKTDNGGYLAGSEMTGWKERYFPFFYPAMYHRTFGEPVYFYSAVYAPIVLHTSITHVWQYYKESDGWVTASRISFPISGGRDAGYRGYSQKASTHPGLWRVLVETEDGRTLSRRTFTIVEVGSPPDTMTVNL